MKQVILQSIPARRTICLPTLVFVLWAVMTGRATVRPVSHRDIIQLMSVKTARFTWYITVVLPRVKMALQRHMRLECSSFLSMKQAGLWQHRMNIQESIYPRPVMIWSRCVVNMNSLFIHQLLIIRRLEKPR